MFSKTFIHPEKSEEVIPCDFSMQGAGQKEIMVTVDFQRLGIRSGYRILDMGCGSGRHMGEAVCFADTEVFGADIHFSDLLQARQRLSDLEKIAYAKGKWHLAVADITRLPFPDNYFDLLICSEVLEHIRDHRQAVREAVRVLKPGCSLVVSVPRCFPEQVCWFLSPAYRNTPGGHIRIYTRKKLQNLLEKEGLKTRARAWAHSLHTPYWWLKCLPGMENNNSFLLSLYHRFLVWDLMTHPKITRFAEKLLNPLMGKSLVLYLEKIR